MLKLEGKTAIVTGAGRGIGEAIVLLLAREGARLTLVSRTEDELKQVADQVNGSGGQALVMPADVAKRAEVVSIVEGTLSAHGKIDILVNAAGIYGPIGTTWEVDADQWIRAMETNLFGTFLCCREVLPHMIREREGKIINFSGGGATSALPRFCAYGVSKTGVVRLTETLAEELKEFNIQVNVVAPGAVDTKLQDEVLAAGERAGELFGRISRLRESGEGGVPRELAAELVLFLASEDSRNLTGRLIAAPYDGWQEWDEGRISEIMSLPWFTLRRMDEFSIKPFLEKLK